MNERNDMDAVLCLGIYEYETEDILPTLLLIDFGSLKTKQQRFQIIERYSSYRLDPDLRNHHYFLGFAFGMITA
jgi:hypothetical protein